MIGPGTTLGRWTVRQWSQGQWQLDHENGLTAAITASAIPAFASRASLEAKLSGSRFGELLVLDHAGGRCWSCRCSCGWEGEKRTDRLLDGVSWCCDPARHSASARAQLASSGEAEPGNLKSHESRPANTRGRRLTHGGETLTVSEWARRLGISPDALRQRLALGWELDRALSETRDPRGRRPETR